MVVNILLHRNVDYEQCLSLQRFLQNLANKDGEDSFMLMIDHPPVYTAGRHYNESDLVDRSVPVHHIERGGSYTYHGPGQLVVYFIVNLKHLGVTMRDFVSSVQHNEVELLSHYGIESESRTGTDAGIWVSGRKISSTGFSVMEFSTMHGIALNINTDLSGFFKINPCGFPGELMTSMHQETGKEIDYYQVRRKAMSLMLKTLGPQRLRIFYSMDRFCSAAGFQ